MVGLLDPTTDMSYTWLQTFKRSSNYMTVEAMSLMGSDANMLIVASTDIDGTSPLYLYLLRKSDGVQIKYRMIDDTLDSGLSNAVILNSNMNTLGYDLISASSATSIYFALGTSDHSQMGLLKLDDYNANVNIEWYQKYDCSSAGTSSCFPTSVLESGTNNDYLYMSSIVETSKTFN